MKRTHEDYLRLLGEITEDMTQLELLMRKVEKARDRVEAGALDELDWAALGYTLHNLYCCFEGYFLRISKFFENGLDPSAWHAELVGRMTLDIPGLRPALFDKGYARRVDELRRFRHAFRNVYASELDPEKLLPLALKMPSLLADFRPFHERYRAALKSIVALLEN